MKRWMDGKWDEWMDEWIDKWMNILVRGVIDELMDEWLNGLMNDVWLNWWMHEWIELFTEDKETYELKSSDLYYTLRHYTLPLWIVSSLVWFINDVL